jgi:hypothetical protein
MAIVHDVEMAFSKECLTNRTSRGLYANADLSNGMLTVLLGNFIQLGGLFFAARYVYVVAYGHGANAWTQLWYACKKPLQGRIGGDIFHQTVAIFSTQFDLNVHASTSNIFSPGNTNSVERTEVR